MKVTLVGSRFTHAAESHYASVVGEALVFFLGEALVVTDTLNKTRFFVLGCSD